MTKITFDEFRPPDFGQGAINEPNHQMVVEWLDALVCYGSIWFFCVLRFTRLIVSYMPSFMCRVPALAFLMACVQRQ